MAFNFHVAAIVFFVVWVVAIIWAGYRISKFDDSV